MGRRRCAAEVHIVEDLAAHPVRRGSTIISPHKHPDVTAFRTHILRVVSNKSEVPEEDLRGSGTLWRPHATTALYNADFFDSFLSTYVLGGSWTIRALTERCDR